MIFKNWILVSAILAVFLFPIAFPLMIDDNPTLKASSQISSTISDSSQQIRQSVSAEFENLDTFTVNPKGGRWDVTETGSTDDQIVDGNLRLITTENTTSSSSEYFMQRGLQSSDDKIDYRYKATMDNSSQVSYGRDVLGDSADFEESDTEGFFKLLDMNTLTSTNGLLTGTIVDGGSTIALIRYNFNNVNLEIYKSIKFSIRASNTLVEWRAGGLGLVFEENGNVGSKYITYTTLTGTIGTSWINYEISFSDFTDASTTNTENMDLFTFGFEDVAGIVYIDNIELIGDLDYATHDSAISDSWDFEDSNEYFFDSYGNVSSFDDGTTEDWVISADDETNPSIENLSNEYLNLTVVDVGETIGLKRTGLSIAASGTTGYDYFTMELYPSIALDRIQIKDGTNIVCDSSTGWTANTWSLFTCDLDLIASWTGTETELWINFIETTFATGDSILINMVYLYDQELGDVEDFNGQSINFDHIYVDPNGYLVTSPGYSTGSPWVRTSANIVDSTVFDTLIIRAKIEGTSRTVTIYDSSIALALGSFLVTSTFTVFTIDLSADSDWSGLVNIIGIRLGAPNNQRLTIDYVLLESSTEQEQEFTLGFWDQDNEQALVNVTHHFYNSSMFRWEIELYDANQEIASYYYSSVLNYTDIYYLVNIKYKWETSDFAVKISYDNGTKIFDVTNKKDFTNTGIAQVFFIQKTPNIFLSTYTVYYGSQEIWIDYINTRFKERTWKQGTKPTDTDWQVDNYDNIFVTKDLDDQQSDWSLNVIDLDMISGTFWSNTTENDGIGTDLVYFSFVVYNVESKTGDLNELFNVTIGYYKYLTRPIDFFISREGVNVSVNQFVLVPGGINNYQAIGFDFSFETFNSREDVRFRTRGFPNINGTTFYDYTSNLTLSEDNSQEFVVKTVYKMIDYHTDAELLASYSDLQIIRREFWEDGGGGSSLGNNPNAPPRVGIARDTGFFAPLINFFIDLINGILLLLGVIISLAITFVIDPIANALGLVFDVVISPLLTAVGGIASAIWSAFAAAAGEFVDAVIGALVTLLNDLWTDIILPIINLTLGVLDVVITAFLGVASSLLDGLLDLIPFGIGDWLRTFTTFDLSNPVGEFIDFVAFLLSLASFGVVLIALGTTAYIFFIPFVNDRDIWDNASVMMSHAFHMHGFDWNTGLGNLTIPVRFNMVLVWIILIALLGWISYILPFSLW